MLIVVFGGVVLTTDMMSILLVAISEVLVAILELKALDACIPEMTRWRARFLI
jgi:hypothetical protein